MNNGEIVKLNLKKLTVEEKKKCAEDFSEGSKELENLLLKMWDNGIETIACCAGHENATGNLKILSPYVSFYIDKFTREQLIQIISKIIDGYNNGLLGFSFYIRKDKVASITIRTYDEKLMKKFFMFLDDLIFNTKNNFKVKQSEKEIIEGIMDMLSLSIKKYLKSKKNPMCQYSMVSVRTIGPCRKINLITKDNCVEKKISNKIGFIKFAEGYYTSIDNDKHYALKDNKVIKLNKEEISNYKQLRTYKKYNSTREFNLDEFKQIIEEIKKHQ